MNLLVVTYLVMAVALTAIVTNWIVSFKWRRRIKKLKKQYNIP